MPNQNDNIDNTKNTENTENIEEEYNGEGLPPRKSSHSSNNKTSIKKEIITTLIQLVALSLIFFAIRQYLFVPVSVEGDSMEPTLSDDNRLLLSKVGKIERFDIVVFPAPDEPDKQFIKRVIGVPGDYLHVSENQLFINGEPVDEPYLDQSMENNATTGDFSANFTLDEYTGESQVPEGQFFLMGDNRENSKDSRMFGFVPIDTVLGKTDYRLWPLDEFGKIDETTENE